MPWLPNYLNDTTQEFGKKHIYMHFRTCICQKVAFGLSESPTTTALMGVYLGVHQFLSSLALQNQENVDPEPVVFELFVDIESLSAFPKYSRYSSKASSLKLKRVGKAQPLR